MRACPNHRFAARLLIDVWLRERTILASFAGVELLALFGVLVPAALVVQWGVQKPVSACFAGVPRAAAPASKPAREPAPPPA